MQILPYHWPFWARPNQLEPEGPWAVWLILAGRGFGKTRAGAEAVRAWLEGPTPLAPGRFRRAAMIAATAADARDVMVEGESGILAVSPPEFRPHWEPSKRRLTWPNGATALVFSGEEPDQLRGPQFDCAWSDELAKWARAEATWDNLQFALRLGTDPRQIVTTTPRPIALLKALVADPGTITTRGSTFENRANLAAATLRRLAERYEGTRFGRQELEAEILEDNPYALWQRAWIEETRQRSAPELVRIAVAVDPPATQGEHADECGIIVAGRTRDGRGYVLDDRTCQGLTPMGWARVAVEAYHRYAADLIVAEVNNGGDMVEAVIRQIDPGIAFRPVRASRGKVARAEPVAALYEQGRVHHVGVFPALEDQLAAFSSTDPGAGGASPDRADALVWALTELMLGRAGSGPMIWRA